MADEFEQIEQEIAVPELFEEDQQPESADEAFETAEEGVEGDELVVTVEEPPAPLGRSWAFDFSTKRFLMSGHSPVETRREQTLRYWIEKCLRTPQGGVPIEPPDYGFDKPTDIFGDQFDSADIATLEERVRDALLFHPAITGITKFAVGQFESDPDEEALQVEFEVILDDDTRLDVAAGVTV